MNRIDELLKNYLKSDNTDYAIMITGDWGCGKSYYIHHDFNDMLHDICSPKKSLFKRNTGIRTYKSFYISLYGLSSEDDFYARVLVAICPRARENKISLLASKTLNRFGFGFSKKDAKSLLKIPDKAVLVFDDLERISSDKISVKETLGLINSFVEHEFQKVIIVCNENAFGEEDERVLKYYKEKTIRYTYLFESNIPEVFDVMLDNVSDECKEYLLNKKTPILQLFKLGGKKNLRTLKFSIDLMNNIYIQISKYSDYKEKILKHIMTSLFIYSMEYKDAHAANELRELKNQLEIDLDWMFPNQNETEKPQKSYSKLASEKYGKTAEFGFWSHSSLDGPIGSKPTSKNAYSNSQMTIEGWANINYNWDKNASAYFYGCRSGVSTDKKVSFTTRLSAKRIFRDVNVYGQTSYAYPSIYSNYRNVTLDMRMGHFSYPTYMVGGKKKDLRTFVKGVSSPSMRRSLNGGGHINNYYQPGKRY